ncbi:MAG: site-2 protease family protein [Acidobacteriota bacterium]|nr:site-2 protease family protein [Acidobacteriota bacterium]
MSDIGQLLIILPVLLLSLTIHEMAHAVTADWYGDPTARRLGRISLNPVVHIDPMGTIMLPLLGILAGGFVFGWAKPVPVNPANLARPRQDFLMIAAAGPVSNVLLAIGASWLLGVIPGGIGAADGAPGLLATFGFAMLQLNLLLAVFNMLPIPPLDGGNVLAGLLPERLAVTYDRLVRPYGFVILLVLMVTGWLYRLIGPPLSFLMGWLLP